MSSILNPKRCQWNFTCKRWQVRVLARARQFVRCTATSWEHLTCCLWNSPVCLTNASHSDYRADDVTELAVCNSHCSFRINYSINLIAFNIVINWRPSVRNWIQIILRPLKAAPRSETPPTPSRKGIFCPSTSLYSPAGTETKTTMA